MDFRAVLHLLNVVLEREHLDCTGRDEERQAVAQGVGEVPEVEAPAQGQLEAARRDRVPPGPPFRSAPQAPLDLAGGRAGRGVQGRWVPGPTYETSDATSDLRA